eukprot:11267477-Prorocentrum_lima.AAC.1
MQAVQSDLNGYMQRQQMMQCPSKATYEAVCRAFKDLNFEPRTFGVRVTTRQPTRWAEPQWQMILQGREELDRQVLAQGYLNDEE